MVGPGYPSDYLRCLNGLTNERPIILYDQLECGKSDRPHDKSLWTLEHFVEEIHIIRRCLALDQIHLLGHSWGSIVVTEYMLGKPSGIASLVLASPCLDVSMWYEDADQNRKTLSPEIQKVFERHTRN